MSEQYKILPSTYTLKINYTNLHESIHEFVIPETNKSSIKRLAHFLSILSASLQAFLQDKSVSDRLVTLEKLRAIENALLSIKVWYDYDVEDELSGFESFDLPAWLIIEEKVIECLTLTRSHAVYLAPLSVLDLNRMLSLASQSISKLQEENVELQDSISNLKIKNNELINTAKTDIFEAKNKTVSEINSITIDITNKVDSKLQENLHSLETLKQDYDRDLKISQQGFDSQLDELNKKLESAIRKEVREFANQKDKLTQVLGSLSEFRRAKSDISHADEQRNEADNLRKYGLILMGLPMVAFFLFFVSVDFGKSNLSLVFTLPPDISGYFLRFLTVLLFSSPSVYLLKESAYHRRQELIYRNRGVQLGSIGAYLDDVPPEMRNKLKSDLVKIFYGPVDNRKADVSNVPDIIQQIKEVAQVSKSLSKVIPTNQNQTNIGNINKASSPSENHQEKANSPTQN
ncbi:hypothetical protein RAL08_004007 [Vibrio parahaemolyticus]|nr:hypothetical protein [Vibrio parahaemolyticus]